MSFLREVFTERNVVVLAFTALIYLIFMNLWMPYWSLYLQELGATKVIIGVIVAAQTASRAIFQLMSGILADKIGRKKCIVVGTAIRTSSMVIFLLAKNWQQVVPGRIATELGSSLIVTAKYPAISESLPPEKRGAVLGYHRMIVSLPTMFMPFLGGIFMDMVGVSVAVRMGFKLQLIAGIVAFLFRAKFVKETLKIEPNHKEEHKKLSLRKNFSAISFRGNVFFMLIVGALSTFATQMAAPFLVIYAVDVAGFSKAQWGIIQSVMGITGVLLSLPGGMLSDRLGRKPLIFLSRFLAPFQRLGLLLLRSFGQILALHTLVGIGRGLGGAEVGVGGPAWTALLADLVPSRDRAKVTGLMALVTGIASMPSSITGGYLWTGFSPGIMLTASFITGVTSSFILYLFVKEPKKREE